MCTASSFPSTADGWRADHADAGRVPTRIVIKECDHDSFAPEHPLTDPVGAVLVLTQSQSAAELITNAADADAILVQYASITAEVMDALPRLRAIGRYGVGVDSVDVAAATARGIAVCNVPDYGTESVSDHAIGLTLAAARGIARLDRGVRAGSFDLTAVRPVPDPGASVRDHRDGPHRHRDRPQGGRPWLRGHRLRRRGDAWDRLPRFPSVSLDKPSSARRSSRCTRRLPSRHAACSAQPMRVLGAGRLRLEGLRLRPDGSDLLPVGKAMRSAHDRASLEGCRSAGLVVLVRIVERAAHRVRFGRIDLRVGLRRQLERHRGAGKRPPGRAHRDEVVLLIRPPLLGRRLGAAQTGDPAPSGPPEAPETSGPLLHAGSLERL